MFGKTAVLSELIGGVQGFARANSLNDDEQDQLKQKYNLSQDANLALRNTGRGVVGGAVGGALGLGGAFKLLGKKSKLFKPIGTACAAIGSTIGGYLSTNKYSKNALSSEMPKHAAYGLVRGYLSTTDLPDDQVAYIKQREGIDQDSNITMRNMGRGVLGDIAGIGFGSRLGGKSKLGKVTCATLGDLISGSLATNKYSL